MRASVPSIVRAWQRAGKVKAVFLADDGSLVGDVDKFLQQDAQNTCVFDGKYAELMDLERGLRQRIQAAHPPADSSYLALRKSTNQRTKFLNRLLVAAGPKGDLLLSGSPQLPLTMPRIVRTLKMPIGTLHSWPSILGMRGAEEWEKHGILVPSLGSGVRIHPRYSVFPPTQQMTGEAGKGKQNYIEALSSFWQRPENRVFGAVPLALEIGSGTGVLSFLFGKLFPNPRILGLDINPEATDCSRDNLSRLRWPAATRFGFATTNPLDNFEWRTDVWQQTGLMVAPSVDYIFANPPWITDLGAEQKEGDTSNSSFRLQSEILHSAIRDDAENAFLPKLFAFAEKNLSNHGRLCIVHSDIAVSLLGARAATVPGLLPKFPNLAIADVARYPSLSRRDLSSHIEIWTIAKR